MIEALTSLLVCQLIGELVVRLAGLPVPGPVVGAALLFGVLARRGTAPAPLRDTAHGLLRHLSLLFVPAGAGIVAHLDRVGAEWLPIGAAVLVSTLLAMAVTALVFAAVSRRAGVAGVRR